MELTSVRCNRCGAPLEIGAQTRFVTCQFCQCQLEVKRTGSAAFTEVVQELAEKTEAMAGNLRVIELQNELERLDREWAMNKEQFYVTGRSGGHSRPSVAGSVMTAVFALSIMVIWIAFAMRMNAPSIFPVFGVVVMVALFVGAASNFNKAGRLNEAEEVHEQKRAALLGQIEAARGSREGRTQGPV